MRAIVFFVLVSLVFPLSSFAQDNDRAGMEAMSLMGKGKTAEAMKIFEDLAAKGEAKAMVQIGICHYEGIGAEKDFTKAMDWFLKAFEKEDADAFVNLGVMHLKGQSVPVNKKIAYCIFLMTHMCGLGSESTQMRSNRLLRGLVEELSVEDIKDCLSNYTLNYMTGYLKARGNIDGIPDEFRPSENNPALKDLNWWMDGELDGILGEPTAEEKEAREKRARQIEAEMEVIRHKLICQFRFPANPTELFKGYSFITDGGMGSGPIKENMIREEGEYFICEYSTDIYTEGHRYISLDEASDVSLAYKIEHPSRPSKADWSEWRKPDFLLSDSSGKFRLLHGREPDGRFEGNRPGIPEMRFKVSKD
ncbi:MAG: sel1 repeat family protein [Victivallales bacterium]|nr:sel1 repeat family protein [Victivallales bacterium]